MSLSYSTSGRSDSFLVLLRSFFSPLFTQVPRRGILRSRYAATCITLSSGMSAERSRTGK